MTKKEIIEKLNPRCNGYDLPLSLNVVLVAEILTEPSMDENEPLNVVCEHDNTDLKNVRCRMCLDCGEIIETDI